MTEVGFHLIQKRPRALHTFTGCYTNSSTSAFCVSLRRLHGGGQDHKLGLLHVGTVEGGLCLQAGHQLHGYLLYHPRGGSLPPLAGHVRQHRLQCLNQCGSRPSLTTGMSRRSVSRCGFVHRSRRRSLSRTAPFCPRFLCLRIQMSL